MKVIEHAGKLRASGFLVACEELDIIKCGTHGGAMDHLWSCKNLKSVRVRHGQISTTKDVAISTI